MSTHFYWLCCALSCDWLNCCFFMCREARLGNQNIDWFWVQPHECIMNYVPLCKNYQAAPMIHGPKWLSPVTQAAWPDFQKAAIHSPACRTSGPERPPVWLKVQVGQGGWNALWSTCAGEVSAFGFLMCGRASGALPFLSDPVLSLSPERSYL